MTCVLMTSIKADHVYSQHTLDRIRAASIDTVPSDQDLVIQSDYILSTVPPRDALATAQRIATAAQLPDTAAKRAERTGSTTKPFVFDLNAISPKLAREIASLFSLPSNSKGDVLAHFLDGGIIGGPPSPQNDGAAEGKKWKKPSLVISGTVVGGLPDTFDALAETLNMKIVGPEIGSASTLKLTFASLTKGLTALSVLSFTTAQSESVLPELLKHLAEYSPYTRALTTHGIVAMAPKAYRWVDEMRYIGETLDTAGHWGGAGASVYDTFAEVYRKIAEDTVLGEENVGNRIRGKTAEDVAEILAQVNNGNAKK